MPHGERVRVARRFLRSIRIDSDLGEITALEGFVCPQSSADVLLTLARHVSENRQGAFTWTGPYGSGKSSLVVALSALLNGNASLQKQAAKVFGKSLIKEMRQALPTGIKGWKVLPVIGRRDTPVNVIGEAVKSAGLVARQPRGGWNEANLVNALTKAASSKPKAHGGLVLFIDEMGKFLEGAAQDGSDIYVLQELAEAASRSNGRLIVVGILHQAFEEYAHRLSHEMRDEWAKIQGRFIDLVVDTAGEEQIDLISRAIESDFTDAKHKRLSRVVATIVRRKRSGGVDSLSETLASCWPLHPVVACLLGPTSRRRFGQNQRSIFGFLNSSEPHGFQDFLAQLDSGPLYTPDKLWDYLRANLEPSILASPDGHRWALAAEAIERCESMGGYELHVCLLKTIAVIDLFKERSGLLANFDLLKTCFPKATVRKLKEVLKQLDGWSFTIFKKFLGAHTIFAGSDFDIDQAVRNSLDDLNEIDLGELKLLAGIQPILAKRHYHDTGAMRWFEVSIVPVSEIVQHAERFQPKGAVIGEFLLAVPTESESEKVAEEQCRKASKANAKWDIVAGISKQSWAVIPLARELFTLDAVSNNHPELQGDPIARREVRARLTAIQALSEAELQKALDNAKWFRRSRHAKVLRQSDLNSIASGLADDRYKQSPRLHNELLNRHRPSSSAVAAQNILLRSMILNEGEERLGIKGCPAEGGLFAAILEATGLYKKTKSGRWVFAEPNPASDPACLSPLWSAALAHIQNNASRTIEISEIFDLWSEAPFGVKDGLMPLLSVAFILSQREKLAIYRDGIFRARFDDVDVEYLAKDAQSIQLRWMDLGQVARALLSGMAAVVRDLDRNNKLENLEPIDVARGLVAIFDNLPEWTKRTMQLSANAVKVRDLFKRAKDPNKFLFDDIPGTLGEGAALSKDQKAILAGVRDGLEELVRAYPAMLQRLREIMLVELHVPNISTQSISELRDRAANIRQLSGDFRLEAFVGRLLQFDGSDEGFEGIASLAANKPPRNWVDPDLDHSAIEIADLAQRFLRAETFARVKGRSEKRRAMAIVIGMDGTPTPILEEFDVADTDRKTINDLIEKVSLALDQANNHSRSIILAVLAEISARYMQSDVPLKKKRKQRSLS